MATQMELRDALVELIRLASTSLPPDQLAAIRHAADGEPEGSMSRETFELMLKNSGVAKESSTPCCQDTGTLLFYVDYGPEYRQKFLAGEIAEAARIATGNAYLRPNAVDSYDGKNSGDNTGLGAPYIHFEEMDESEHGDGEFAEIAGARELAFFACSVASALWMWCFEIRTSIRSRVRESGGREGSGGKPEIRISKSQSGYALDATTPYPLG